MARLDNYNKISKELILDFDCNAVYNILKILKLEDNEIYAEIEDSLIKKIIDDILNHNKETIIDKYYNHFKSYSIEKHIIRKGAKFFRARKGCIELENMDSKQIYKIPFFGKNIAAPPCRVATEQRFNKAGTSYTYLGDSKETCFYELRPQVGNYISVGNFQLVDDVNAVYINNEKDLSIWYKIITEPACDKPFNYYIVTQFLSDIIRKVFDIQVLKYDSIQYDGYNLVCFDNDKLKFVDYSDNLYYVNKSKNGYKFEKVDDFYDKLIEGKNDIEEVCSKEDWDYNKEYLIRKQNNVGLLPENQY